MGHRLSYENSMLGVRFLFERNLYDYYHLFCDERYMIGDYEALTSQGQLYIFIPSTQEREGGLRETLRMAEYLQSRGELGVAELVTTVNGRHKSIIDGQEGYLLKLPLTSDFSSGTFSVHRNYGGGLAMFHKNGEHFGYQRQSSVFYFGKWKEIWEQRLEQLERWYQQLLQQGPQTEVDDLFITTFPYYLALSENAIQYVVDTNLDDPHSRMEFPVICHKKFTDQTWLKISSEGVPYKLCTDFVIDHPSRDIAEWIRYGLCQKNCTKQEVIEFVLDYEKLRPISNHSWRLIYSRLLFPLHYFDAVEQYYSNQIVDKRILLEERFLTVLELERENEDLLRGFFQEIPSIYPIDVPKVEWLNNL